MVFRPDEARRALAAVSCCVGWAATDRVATDWPQWEAGALAAHRARAAELER